MYKPGDIIKDVHTGEYMEVLEPPWHSWYKIRVCKGDTWHVKESEVMLASATETHAYLMKKSGNKVTSAWYTPGIEDWVTYMAMVHTKINS